MRPSRRRAAPSRPTRPRWRSRQSGSAITIPFCHAPSCDILCQPARNFRNSGQVRERGSYPLFSCSSMPQDATRSMPRIAVHEEFTCESRLHRVYLCVHITNDPNEPGLRTGGKAELMSESEEVVCGFEAMGLDPGLRKFSDIRILPRFSVKRFPSCSKARTSWVWQAQEPAKRRVRSADPAPAPLRRIPKAGRRRSHPDADPRTRDPGRQGHEDLRQAYPAGSARRLWRHRLRRSDRAIQRGVEIIVARLAGHST